MFCYQCEQTKRQEDTLGCAGPVGTCGKDETTSDLQDILIYLLKGISQYQKRLLALGQPMSDTVAELVLFGLFTTLTNVNFNPTRFNQLIEQAKNQRDQLKTQYEAVCAAQGITPETLSGAATFTPAGDLSGLLAQAQFAAVKAGAEVVGDDAVGLRVLILYGLKGCAAYAFHAWQLGQRRSEINEEMVRLLAYLAEEPTDIEELLTQALAVGQLNLIVMETLDKANTEAFGDPEVTQVRITPVAGKAILVSGHDLYDLHQILEATKDQGINVYTHGELLPANAYPKLKAYPHLVGNFGGAWQNQQSEFADFPGPIVLTSNCLIEPKPGYRQRLFTTGPVGWSGIKHLSNNDYRVVIQAAKALPGFKEDAAEQRIPIGFGRKTLFGAAGTVIDAVKQGAIKHFFLIGGCDGAVPGRNYYTELAEQTPQDSVILTLGCGKYRFNKENLGSIGDLPRVLDVGQCNDAHSAIEIAKALAGAFNCGVNDLPLSLMVSWFEQKATAVFLSLLALNIKGIHLGPSLPAYLTPNLLTVLQQRFDVRANGSVAEDLAQALAS